MQELQNYDSVHNAQRKTIEHHRIEEGLCTLERLMDMANAVEEREEGRCGKEERCGMSPFQISPFQISPLLDEGLTSHSTFVVARSDRTPHEDVIALPSGYDRLDFSHLGHASSRSAQQLEVYIPYGIAQLDGKKILQFSDIGKFIGSSGVNRFYFPDVPQFAEIVLGSPNRIAVFNIDGGCGYTTIDVSDFAEEYLCISDGLISIDVPGKSADMDGWGSKVAIRAEIRFRNIARIDFLGSQATMVTHEITPLRRG